MLGPVINHIKSSLFNLPVEHVAAVLNQCDSKDGNGKLDYREFAHYLTRASFPTNPTSQTQAVTDTPAFV